MRKISSLLVGDVSTEDAESRSAGSMMLEWTAILNRIAEKSLPEKGRSE